MKSIRDDIVFQKIIRVYEFVDNVAINKVSTNLFSKIRENITFSLREQVVLDITERTYLKDDNK